MDNTFENAQSYVKHLDEINKEWNLDKQTIVSALMSYSAKTNVLNKESLVSLLDKFRNWQRQWDLFGAQEILVKPPHFDKFIDNILDNGINN